MPSIDKWAGDAFPLSAWSDDVDPAMDAARLIAEKPTTITVGRAGVGAQTVRIEELRREREVVSPGGQTAIVDTLVIGYKGHPTINDTDLQRGDRFAVGGVSYEIIALVPAVPNQLQAYAKVRN